MESGNRSKHTRIQQTARIKNVSSRSMLVIISLVIFAAGIAALPNTTRRVGARTTQDKPKSIPSVQSVTPAATAPDDDQEGDADLPPRFRGRIDKETYLRLRDQHTSLLRGIDTEDGKTFDPQWRTTALRQMEQQERANAPELSGTTWTEIGPFNLPNGQTQQFPATTAVNGRVTAVAVDPTNSNTIYVGSAQGGVWRSTNGGTTWTAIFDTAQSLAIGSIALAPSNPTILYVGTGEPNNSGDCFFGVGVYRIDNANTTADLVGPINPSITTGTTTALTYNCFNGRAISKILVNPTDPATIYVSTATGIGGVGSNALSNTIPPLALRGVFRSTNATAAAASVTFTKLIVNTDGSLDVPGTGNTSIFDMVLEPGNASNLLVSTSGTTTGGVIMRSTNALAATPTFTQTLFPGFNNLVMKLAINKVGAVVTAYVSSNEPSAAASGCGSNSGRVRKSTDGGVTWSAPLAGAEGYCGGQCSYDNPIGVDPNNANIVYLGGNARSSASACPDVLKRSSDGGTTFTRDDTGLHADSHAFGFDTLTPTTTVWFGTDGGVWKRQDAPAGTAWLSQNLGALGMIQFQSIAVHPTDQFFTIGGTQDNGTEAQQISSGTWLSAESGDGGFALIDQSATNTTNVTMYHTFFNQRNGLIGFDRTNLGACLAVKDSWEFRGINGGVDATLSCDGTAFAATNGITSTDFVNFYAPMALGPGTPNTFYFGTDRLYRSTDKGDVMTAVSQAPITAGTPISAIGIGRTNDNVRIVGLNNGSVFATTTGANPLVNASFPIPTNATASTTNRFISRAVVDPSNSNTAYITLAYYTNPATAGNVWRTTNLNGAPPTWTSIGNTGTGLSNIPVNAFAVDANDPTHPGISVLYAGSDIGVFRSTDSGASWTVFGTGLPRSAVFDMAIQPSFRILRVATHGRGMWEIALPGSPTAAKLSSFTANATDDGQVLIQWRTGAEVDNLGFNIYREQDGRRVRVTPQLVAGSALLAGPGAKLTSGNSYVWSDTPPPGKPSKYLLEDIDINGKSAWNGPIAIGSSVGKGSAASAQQATLLTRLGLRQSQLSNGLGSVPAERSAKPAPTAVPFALANGSAIKLSVNREGWYRVTQRELIAAGLDSKVNPRFLQLLVDGREVPIIVQGEQDGRFEPADAVEFYGVGLDAASSDTRVYWLAAGGQPGLRIEKVQAKGSTVASPSFAYTVERKDRTIYFSALRNGDAENFFGPVIAREPVDQTLTLQRIDTASISNAQIQVALQGVTQQLHQVQVLLNGADAGSVDFVGQSKGVANLTVPQTRLIDGENVVRLIAQAGETDVSLVDSVRITYQHTYTAESDALRLSATDGQQVTMDGFTGTDVRVFDVTNPDALQELATVVKPQKGSYSATTTAAGAGQRTLLALTGSRAKQVASARANRPSNWRQPSNGADLVIITHSDFAGSIGSLRLLRQSQGLSSAIIDVEDIFDEFSYGDKSPQSVKDFLAYAKGNWKKAPRYVLLVGDSSLDPKNYLGYGDSDYVPTKLLDTQLMQTASDNWLADFNGDGVEELAIGRLPVRTAQEAATMINKIVSYDSGGRSESMLLVADRNDGFNFEAANAVLRSLIPADFRVEEIDRSASDDATAKNRLIEAVNRGQKIVNYTGHGSVDNWKGQILTNEDALALTNTNGLSLFITMTCLNGYYQDPVVDGLAESLMKASRGGAVAVWASSGMTSPGNQAVLNQQLYRLLFDRTVNGSMGDLTMRAKSAILDPDIRRTWVLFGDPSMKLK